MKTLAQEEQITDELSQEAAHILEILDQIENHTANLRKKLMLALKSKNDTIRLKLDEV
jgi:hypothetical protein